MKVIVTDTMSLAEAKSMKIWLDDFFLKDFAFCIEKDKVEFWELYKVEFRE